MNNYYFFCNFTNNTQRQHSLFNSFLPIHWDCFLIALLRVLSRWFFFCVLLLFELCILLLDHGTYLTVRMRIRTIDLCLVYEIKSKFFVFFTNQKKKKNIVGKMFLGDPQMMNLEYLLGSYFFHPRFLFCTVVFYLFFKLINWKYAQNNSTQHAHKHQEKIIFSSGEYSGGKFCWII